jgi:hypothetical protein
MSRLLGIVHMNPEKSRSEWGHEEVSPVEISQLYNMVNSQLRIKEICR